MRAKDNKAKAKMKAHADSHCHVTPHTLTPGDTVLHHQPKQNKLTTPYNCKPYTMSKTEGSMITAVSDGHSIVRNSSFFKKVPAELPDFTEDPDDDDDGSEYNYSTGTTYPRYPTQHNKWRLTHLKDYM